MPPDILLNFGRKCATDANSTFDDQRSTSSEGPEPTTPEGDREPNEPEPLCPASFLTGWRLTALPALLPREIGALSCMNLKQMISRRDKLLVGFWRRWAREYLQELQATRTKRNQRLKQVNIGDVVLLKETAQPRQRWKMGTIERGLTGRDGRVRAFEVRMPGGVTLRPIQLVYPLEITT
ncbi:hypothetical protein MTO96_040840 [Rhipicephalus appendiculatus]